MANTDFAGLPAGSNPSGWTAGWNSSTGDFPIATRVEMMGDRAIRVAMGSTVADRLLTYDTFGSESDVVALAKVRCAADSGIQLGLVARASTSGGGANGLALRMTGDEIQVVEYTSGTASQLGISTGTVNWTENFWYWLEFSVQSTAMEGRMWAHGTTRPGTAHVSVNTTLHASAGAAGILAGNGPGVKYLDYIEVSTGSTITYPVFSGGFSGVGAESTGTILFDNFDRSAVEVSSGSPLVGTWGASTGTSLQISTSSTGHVRHENGDGTRLNPVTLSSTGLEEIMLVIKGNRDDAEMSHSVRLDTSTAPAWGSENGYQHHITWSGGFPVSAEVIWRLDAGSLTNQNNGLPGPNTFMSDSNNISEGRVVFAPGLQAAANDSIKGYNEAHEGFTHLWARMRDFGASFTQWDHFGVYRNNRLVAKELPDGYQLKALGQTAVAQGGLAIIQFERGFSTSFVFDSSTGLQILTSTGGVVQTTTGREFGAGTVLGAGVTPPDTPTLVTDSYGATWWRVEGSVYTNPSELLPQRSQYQLDNSSDFTTPTSTLTFGASTDVPAFSYFADWTGLQPNSTYWSRVRYRGTLWSEWSPGITIVTTTAPTPVQPTLSGVAFDDGVTLTGSTYDHQAGKDGGGNFIYPHKTSDWEVANGSDAAFTSPVATSTANPFDLEGITFSGMLSPLMTYLARARYRDDQGIFSTWSPSYLFNTPSTPITAPGTPTVTVPSSGIGIYGATLVSSTYNHAGAEAHEATWWKITNTSGFESVWGEEVSTGDLLSWSSTNVGELEEGATYWARARWQDASGDYGAWSAPVSFATLSAPGFATFTAPVGMPSVSTGVTLSADLNGGLTAGYTVHFQERDLNSTAWNTLQNTTATSYTWDTSTISSVIKETKIEVVSTSGVTQAHPDYRVFPVNSTGNVVEQDLDDITPGTNLVEQGFTPHWDHQNVIPGFGYTAYYANGGILSAYSGSGGEAMMSLREVDSPVKVTVISRFMISGFENGIVGDAGSMWDTELNHGGHGLMTSGRKNVPEAEDITPRLGWGVAAGIFPNNEWGGCLERGKGDGFIVMSVRRSETNEGLNRKYSFSVGKMQALNRRCHGKTLPQPVYTLISQFTPSNINDDGTFDGTLRTKLFGPWQESNDWQAEVTLTDLNFGCGLCGYWHDVPSQFWGQPFQVFSGLTVVTEEQIDCVTGGCPASEFPIVVSNISETAVTLTGPTST